MKWPAVVDESPNAIGVRVANLMRGTDPRLDPVRRWFGLRRNSTADVTEDEVINLDHDALRALAELMQVSAADLRQMLTQHS